MSQPIAVADPGRRFRDANEAELGELLARELKSLDSAALRHLFRNPFLTRAMIEQVLSVPEYLAAYEVRLEAARHPRTPQLAALRFLSGLYWPDLVRIGLDTHLHPLVRRAADLRLSERLPGLAIGEKIAIARTASQGLIGFLRADPTPRVIEALLENPRLTESLLLPLVGSDAASPRVLAVVAASAKWGARYPVRVALCRNPKTPVDRALQHLPMLKRPDLEAVSRDARLTLPVRRRAELLARSRDRDAAI